MIWDSNELLNWVIAGFVIEHAPKNSLTIPLHQIRAWDRLLIVFMVTCIATDQDHDGLIFKDCALPSIYYNPCITIG